MYDVLLLQVMVVTLPPHCHAALATATSPAQGARQTMVYQGRRQWVGGLVVCLTIKW